MPAPFSPPRFYPILDTAVLESRGCTALLAAQALLDAGARILQYRHKDIWLQVYFDEARAVSAMCQKYGALFVLNDRADFARILGAALHVGQQDLPPAACRVVSAAGVLGFSTHNASQLRRADDEPADYLSIGPIFATSSKEKPDPVVGLDGLTKLRPMTRKPVVAIGGITLQNAAQVLAAKADSVAVISGILPEVCDSVNIHKRAKEWLEITSS